MTDFIISDDNIQRQYLRSGDTLTVGLNGIFHPSGNAIEWDLSGPAGQVRLNVEGAIRASSGAAIETVGTATSSQDIAIITQEGSSIRALGSVMHIASSPHGGSVGLDNRGLLKSLGGSVVDAVVSGTPAGSGISPFYLLNYASGTMQSEAGTTIRLSNEPTTTPLDGYLYISNLGTIQSNGKDASAGSAIDTSSLYGSPSFLTRIINWENGSIIAADADAIRPGDHTEITVIGGTVRAGGGKGNDGIDIGNAVGVSIRNDAGADIRGADSGIAGDQAARIENSGSILGRLGAGIDLNTAPTSVTTIVNHTSGSIRSYGEGLGIHVSGLVDLTNDGVIRKAASSVTVLAVGGGTVINTGSITASSKTIMVSDGNGGAAHGALNLTNSGTIVVDPSALFAGASAINIIGDFNDTLVNTGTIQGDIRLGGGNDRVVTSAGRMTGTLYGEAGDDTIDVGVNQVNFRVFGGDGNDTISGTGSLHGDGGDDHIIGLAGGNWNGRFIYGGDGNDVIETSGDHIIDGGNGYDTLILHSEHRTSGLNIQRLIGEPSSGGASNVEAVNIFGTQFDDIILADKGGAADNKIYGGDGNDSLSAGGGINLLDGGAGDDHYLVENTTTKIIDESGDDFVATKVDYRIDVGIETVAIVAQDLTVTGNWQANRIWGSDGADEIYGMGGVDLIGGNAGDDIIDGGADTDTLHGNDGSDVLFGGVGRDYLNGGADDDRLIGGAEYDHLIGGDGADIFEFHALSDSSASEADLILDFSRAQGDSIDLSKIDADLSTSADDPFIWLSSGAFTGQAGELRYGAVNGDTRIEGDVDGDGNADFAILLSGVSTLNASDFLL